MNGPYDDIMNLPNPTSKKHARMSAHDRAAQFSPFAALTGHDAAISETARLTERRLELDEDVKAALDRKLHMAAELRENNMKVAITYFKEDKAKAGGAYETVDGYIKKMDDYDRVVILTDGTRIPIDDIFELNSELFCFLQ